MSAPATPSKGTGRTIIIAVVVILIVAAIGAYYLYSGMGSGGSTNTSTVTIPSGTGASQGLNFSPQSISVASGTTIKFVNNDNTLHTVTFTSAPSGVSLASISDSSLAAGSTFTVTLSTPGTYQYHCTIHSWMTGTITVT